MILGQSNLNHEYESQDQSLVENCKDFVCQNKICAIIFRKRDKIKGKLVNLENQQTSEEFFITDDLGINFDARVTYLNS